MILPEHVKLLLMECRGLPVRVLQEVVRQTRRDSRIYTSCGERHLSITRTRAYKKNPAELMKHFDFVGGVQCL